MIRERQLGYLSFFLAIECTVIFGSFLLWHGFLEYLLHRDLLGHRHWQLASSLVVLVVLATRVLRLLNEHYIDANMGRNFRAAVWDWLLVSLLCLLMLVMTRDLTISRTFILSYLPVLFVVIVACNIFLPSFLSAFIFKRLLKSKTLIILWPEAEAETEAETEAEWRRLRLWVEGKSSYGVEIIGRLGRAGTREMDDLPCLGSVEQLREVCDSLQVEHVMAFPPHPKKSLLNDLILQCERAGVRLSVLGKVKNNLVRIPITLQIGGESVIQFLEEPLQNPFNAFLKRCFDVLASLAVLTMVFPVVALLTLVMQRLQSPGPLLFRQKRSGGRSGDFLINKFRTMGASTTRESDQTSRTDPRVYPFGKFLRKSSLDEIPQFLNVLKGEMSVVGPRPHLAEHDDLWNKTIRPYRFRSLIKPGITGLAQINGLRGEVTNEKEIRQRVEYDIDYIERWSLPLDLWIVFKSVFTVILPDRKAY